MTSKGGCILVVCCLVMASASVHAGDEGLVACYNFDEGSGDILKDVSGNGNDGRISGAEYVRRGDGYALRFDGATSYVDCGQGPSLDLEEAVTVALWVKVLAIPQAGEPIVVGKGANSAYGFTCYRDNIGPTNGRIYFYIGTENIATPVALDAWQHLAATFDGHTIALYVNGEAVASKGVQMKIPRGGSLLMGKGGFCGLLDDVRIFSRALSPDEIRASCDTGRLERQAHLRPFRAIHSLQGGIFQVLVGEHGGVEVTVGGDNYFIESSFSYPGERMGLNVLSEEEPAGEKVWVPLVSRSGPDEIHVVAAGPFYSLDRKISVSAHRIAVTDILSSRSADDVGVVVSHRVVPSKLPRGILLAGAAVSMVAETPENPTVFLSLPGSHLGVVAEDTLSRVQFEAASSHTEAGFSLRRLALRPNASLTLRWAVYPFGADADYFAFVNSVRQDWKTNFTIEGPFDFGPPSQVWENPERLRAYLLRKRLRIAAPGPWLDYDNGWLSLGLDQQRAEYKKFMRGAAAALKAVDPGIRVVGNMEGPLVTIPPELAHRLWEALPPDRRAAGYPIPFTDRQLALIEDLSIRQKDSLVQGPGGERYYELYYRGPEVARIPLMAILVYPASGNGQLEFWMDQARFIMEDVGLDGVYLDGGGPVRGARYGYDRWDGVTVEIDPRTGRIVRRVTDYMSVIGDVPVRTLFDYVLSRKGTMVANGHHYTEEMQPYPIPRFLETGGEYDPLAVPDGEKPPLLPLMCKGHLDAPIALANPPETYGERAIRNYARFVMKSVITHLRHGLLYYYYNTEIPESGPGSGEYGPINHMFPITPIEIHEGWILGKERVISARSIAFDWHKQGRPLVHIFDLAGREGDVGSACHIVGANDAWHIVLTLRDWQEIAVVE